MKSLVLAIAAALMAGQCSVMAQEEQEQDQDRGVKRIILQGEGMFEFQDEQEEWDGEGFDGEDGREFSFEWNDEDGDFDFEGIPEELHEMIEQSLEGMEGMDEEEFQFEFEGEDGC